MDEITPEELIAALEAAGEKLTERDRVIIARIAKRLNATPTIFDDPGMRARWAEMTPADRAAFLQAYERQAESGREN